MSRNRFFWTMTLLALVFGALWGLSMQVTLSGLAISSFAFIGLGSLLFVIRVAIEAYYRQNYQVGTSGAIFLLGVMAIGSLLFAFSMPGLLLGIVMIGVAGLMEYSVTR